MSFLLGCSCFKCSHLTSKGSYNTYGRERKQQLGREVTEKEERETANANCPINNDRNETTNDTTTGTTTTNELNNKKQSKTKKMEATGHPSSRHTTSSKLSSFTLDGIAELISEQKIAKSSVIVLVGAGMSTAAGVPDFRSPDTGIYANLQKYNLPHPEDAFHIDCFKNKPEIFYDLSKAILPKKLFPTISHFFIRLLHEKGYLLRCYSQNVDGLESICGLPKDKVCLAHGSFETGHCLRCNAEYSLAWMQSIVESGGIPHCTKTQDCKGLVKPDIKFFGERLDMKFFRLVKEDFGDKCQLLIIIGTSLKVMPFARLVQRVPEDCPRLLINKTRCGHDIPLLFRIFSQGDGLLYGKSNNKRDVAFIGDCDEGTMQLAKLLHWDEELLKLMETRRRELEQEQDPSNDK
uniref:NAD-dependent deacetylase sirtuin-2 n=1 Tax=Aceria tosichella TaxID=561515 RepID=A0A6G1S9Q1_9ACAR